MREIRTFEKSDWDCWAGAERFSTTQAPIILGLELDFNAEATIIADKNGIEINIGSGEAIETWSKSLELSRIRAEGELRAIERAIKELTYAPDLAYELDHPTTEATKGFQFNGIME